MIVLLSETARADLDDTGSLILKGVEKMADSSSVFFLLISLILVLLFILNVNLPVALFGKIIPIVFSLSISVRLK